MVRGRTLVAHGEAAYREWGTAGMGSAERLWSVRDAGELVHGHGFDAGQRSGAVFGAETLVERVGDDALAPLAGVGDFADVDPDEPAAHGRIVAVWADGPGSATLVRRPVVEDGGPHAARCEPRPARHGGDPRQRDDDLLRGGVRRPCGLRRNAPSLPAGPVAQRRTPGAVSQGNTREIR